MPRGIKGSGPYSKVNADGSKKEKGEVRNDLAVALKDESATDKASASPRKAAPRKAAASTTPAKRAPRKAAAATNGNGSANGNGNGRTSVERAVAVTVEADGTISFVGDSGAIQKIQLSSPTYLLTLEKRVKEATDQYVRDLAASRS